MTTANKTGKVTESKNRLDGGSESTEIMFKKSFEVLYVCVGYVRLYIYVTGFGIEFFWGRLE